MKKEAKKELVERLWKIRREEEFTPYREFRKELDLQ